MYPNFQETRRHRVVFRIKGLTEDMNLEIITVQAIVETMGVDEISLGECKRTTILNYFVCACV